MKLALLSLLAIAQALSFGLGLDRTPNRLIKLGEGQYELVSESKKFEYKREGKKFFDVTNVMAAEPAVQILISGGARKNTVNVFMEQFDLRPSAIKAYDYPKTASQQKVIAPLLLQINIDSVRANLGQFTSFYTRYYKSSAGFESANWLYGSIEDIVLLLPADAVTLTKVKHEGWDQYLIIVSLVGESENKVVVGAHQDLTNLLFPNLLRAPGADDDGSGTVTTLEALRLVVAAIVNGSLKLHNTLEFHYYSAEEGGLLGSMDVFSRYSAQNATVVGMLQQDMTGSVAGSLEAGVEPHFGLISDFTAAPLNDFLKVVIDEYCAIPFHETECGYACLDHASAIQYGYPASFMIESEFKYTSKQIHLTMDTMDRLDFDHIKEHVKLTLGYAIELASAESL